MKYIDTNLRLSNKKGEKWIFRSFSLSKCNFPTRFLDAQNKFPSNQNIGPINDPFLLCHDWYLYGNYTSFDGNVFSSNIFHPTFFLPTKSKFFSILSSLSFPASHLPSFFHLSLHKIASHFDSKKKI